MAWDDMGLQASFLKALSMTMVVLVCFINSLLLLGKKCVFKLQYLKNVWSQILQALLKYGMWCITATRELKGLIQGSTPCIKGYLDFHVRHNS